MGALIIRRTLTLSLAFILSLSALPSFAATTKPAPKVTTKATAKATAKPKVTKKPIVKKRAVYKRKVVKVSPSPSPGWPPKGFLPDGNTDEIYAKLPTTKELLGVLSANPNLSKQMKSCSRYACGAV
jgi:septal ring-binding cell division protein DamX